MRLFLRFLNGQWITRNKRAAVKKEIVEEEINKNYNKFPVNPLPMVKIIIFLILNHILLQHDLMVKIMKEIQILL